MKSEKLARSVTKGQELITNSLFSYLQNAVLSEAEGTKNANQ